jgi:hypothetical protein
MNLKATPVIMKNLPGKQRVTTSFLFGGANTSFTYDTNTGDGPFNTMSGSEVIHSFSNVAVPGQELMCIQDLHSAKSGYGTLSAHVRLRSIPQVVPQSSS